MRRIIERTLKSLGVPDHRVDYTQYGNCLHAIIGLDLSEKFFRELNKAAERSKFTYVVNCYDTNRLLINFFRR